jgi:hypothetical protein
MSRSHTSAAVGPDIYLLAWTLFIGGYAEPTVNTCVTSYMFDSMDIIQAGMDVLEEQVD